METREDREGKEHEMVSVACTKNCSSRERKRQPCAKISVEKVGSENGFGGREQEST